ncbi:MAG: DVUA0089 family protein [Cellvibrionaceae bacterium]
MTKRNILAAVLMFMAAGSANAALINFTGEIEYHNDVVFTYFTVEDDATDVRVWTDSFMSGENFDPIAALWSSDGSLIMQNDDNDGINPDTQTYYDSGFFLDNLAAGEYIFSVSTYNNFANGSSLSDGFRFDDQDSILLSEWCQPANTCGMGPNWSVWLDGVDSARSPDATVPEPSSVALLGLGLAALGFSRRKSKA